MDTKKEMEIGRVQTIKIISTFVEFFNQYISDEYLLILDSNGSICVLGKINQDDLTWWVHDKLSNDDQHRARVEKIAAAYNDVVPWFESNKFLFDKNDNLEIKVWLLSNEFVYRIKMGEDAPVDVTIDLTSAYLGKSTFYNLYRVLGEVENCTVTYGAYSFFADSRTEQFFTGSLYSCMIHIFDTENSSPNPYQEYKHMYPKNWQTFTATDVLCKKAWMMFSLN